MGTPIKKNKKKGSIIPLILGCLLIFAIIIGIGYMYYFPCKDGEEMIDGKCLVKCTDGKTRVGVVCTTPTSSTLLICKDDEEKVGDKCLIKCTDGQTRVGVVCKLVCKSDEDPVDGKCLVKCEDGKVRVAGVCRTPTGSTPTGSTSTGSKPTGSTSTGSTPTGSTPTGSTSTGSTSTGSTSTGSTPTGIKPFVCADTDDLVEGTCLIKCTGGQTRVNGVCTAPIFVKPAAVLTKFIEFTKGSGVGTTDWYVINLAEMYVKVMENGNFRQLTKDDFESYSCDGGSDSGYCKTYPPSYMIDNDGNTFASTGRDSPKLLFILKKAQEVVEVTVANRYNCCRDRIDGVKLSLYTENMTPIKTCTFTKETGDTYSTCTI